MKKFTLLGFSPAVVGIVTEILRSGHHGKIKISIISNVESIDIPDHQFRFSEVEYEILESSDWTPTHEQYILGVNKSKTKEIIYHYFLENFNITKDSYHTIIHKASNISETVHLGYGVVINPGVSIAPFANLHDMVSINRNVSVGHHSALDLFTTIHPGVNIAGHCKIGTGVTIGMGSNIIDGISIGNHSIIGAGSLVTKDIPANVLAFGSPAKVIKTLEN